jgi:HPt (histidine-containing phosphotransfer) domain-containing protein
MSDSIETVIDPAAIDRLREWGGDKLVREMIRLYLENAATRLGQIDEGLAPGGTLARTQQGAHSLKSSALNVGAHHVSRLAAEMEPLAGSGDHLATAALREPLGQALEEARTALTRIVEELDS